MPFQTEKAFCPTCKGTLRRLSHTCKMKRGASVLEGALTVKRRRGDAPSQKPPQRSHVDSFWYVRNDQAPVSLELFTQETGDQLVSFDRRRLHGSWDYSENPNTFTVNFNANPDKLPRAHTFTQIVNTDVYRHVGNKAECTVFLIYLPYASYIETR